MTLREELNELERQKFETLDWTKRSEDLAKETGFSYQIINRWRKRLGKAKVTKFSQRFADAVNWDWTKSNTDLAVEHGLIPQIIYQLRCTLNKPPSPPRDYSRPVFAVNFHTYAITKWQEVDWAKNDIEIAEEEGCTREWVRCKRAELGKPPSPHKWRLRKFVRFARQFQGRETLTHEEANAFEPIEANTFRGYCKQLGIALPEKLFQNGKQLYPWHLVNFDIPNKLLKEIWGIHPHAAASWRCRHLKPRGLFVYHKHVPNKFVPIVEAERQKAAEWKAQLNGNGEASHV